MSLCRPIRSAAYVLTLFAAAMAALPGIASAEQASQPTEPLAGSLTTGFHHSCAVHASLRCWGFGGNGQLGYGDTRSIGDDETPGSVGPVNLGAGRTAKAISAGDVHTCAILDDDTVRCWGFGGNGRLGYGNESSLGTTPGTQPGLLPPVDLGATDTAKAISAGDGHTCAILTDNTVRCWGYGFDGRLGYNNTESIGDNETPGAAGPVNFGLDATSQPLTAKAISAGNAHTCAILSDNTVRCWGFASQGRLGYGTARCITVTTPNTTQCPVDVGRGCITLNNVCDPTNPVSADPPSPANMGPVNLGVDGGGQPLTAKAISAGRFHTCAILSNDAVRCWGFGGSGRLGYGNDASIGNDLNETPGTVGPVNLGTGRTARAISAGGHTCAVLDDASVRCWGGNAFGQLGYGHVRAIGNEPEELPVPPVNLGTGRTARAVSAGLTHTCARLDDQSIRCWGDGRHGRLGYCNEATIGDDETPGSVGPVELGLPGIAGAACPPVPPRPAGPSSGPGADSSVDGLAAALAAQRKRAAAFASCLATVRRKARAELRQVRSLPSSQRRSARRKVRRRAARKRRGCVRRHGRVPGRVTRLIARPTGAGAGQLLFLAVGTDGSKEPAAHTYLIKQSRRPIRSRRSFRRAASLCDGKCRFKVTRVGATISVNVNRLRSGATYYYAIAGRDNVTLRLGPRSRTVSFRAP